MALVKAMIINTDTWEPIPIMFNPEEYSISQNVEFSDPKAPGMERTVTEFSHGTSETLSMELFFDTYESGVDVRLYTERIANLLEINPRTDKPPVCLFVWGSLTFKCMLQSITKKFTMFNTFGLPVRATLSVTFHGYNELKFLLAKNPFRSLGHEQVYIIKAGETLSQIAWNVFQDPNLWRDIADYNKIENPKELQPGQVLRIPPK